MDDATPLLALIPILAMIVMHMRSSNSIQELLPCCIIDQSSPPAAQEQAAPVQAAPVQSAPRVETEEERQQAEEERQQARRLKILTTLVHKVS
jgi:hypothetical protein